jgi:hypothetical protein
MIKGLLIVLIMVLSENTQTENEKNVIIWNDTDSLIWEDFCGTPNDSSIATLFNTTCATVQQTINEVDVKISFDGKPIHRTNRITIYFTSGIDDTLVVKHNNAVLQRGFVKSDWSTSFTGIAKTVDIRKGKEIEVLELNSGRKITIKLIEGYKIIELSKVDNKWAVLYSNRPPIFE